MKNHRKEVIWRDRKYLGFLFLLIFFLLFIFVYFISAEGEGMFIKIAYWIFLLYILFELIRYSLIKYVMLKRDGIYMHDVRFNKRASFKVTNRFIFVKWDRIKFIKIVNKEVKTGYGMLLLYKFIIVKTKDKKYMCQIINVKGFLKALKAINKYSLLSKDSRYK